MKRQGSTQDQQSTHAEQSKVIIHTKRILEVWLRLQLAQSTRIIESDRRRPMVQELITKFGMQCCHGSVSSMDSVLETKSLWGFAVLTHWTCIRDVRFARVCTDLHTIRGRRTVVTGKDFFGVRVNRLYATLNTFNSSLRYTLHDQVTGSDPP